MSFEGPPNNANLPPVAYPIPPLVLPALVILPPDVGRSTLRPKWWIFVGKTISDIDELIKGGSSQNKVKQPNTINFALMVHSIYETETFKEATGIPQWKQAMDVEYHSPLKNCTGILSTLPTRKKPISYK